MLSKAAMQMADLGFIAKTPKLHRSQDYEFLRSTGLRYIEMLAHQLWTDYNVHDPGITLLELLCYAITDLGYRAGYDIKDILTGQGASDTASQFHRARAVLSSGPVTFDDLRKLIIDIPGVRNAWVEKHDSVSYYFDVEEQRFVDGPAGGPHLVKTPSLSGLYDVFIEYEDSVRETPVPSPSVHAQDKVLKDVRNVIFSHRNLCEDVVRICKLDKEKIAVCANIEVRPSADLEELLAEIFYRVETHISPPVRFYTLAEMLARRKPVEEIFEGPALEHGFIDDEEFRLIKRRCEIRVSDIINLLLETELADVLAIKSISLLSFIDDKLRIQRDWLLPLATDKFRAPAFSPDLSKIVFFKNGLPYTADRERVAELLKRKGAGEGRFKPKAEEKDLPVPNGEYRATAEYYPAQNDLPAIYCVGQVRMAASEPSLRKAQAKQLKAYLLFFEQLLANYLAQLEQVRQLFSWDEHADRTYFSQVVSQVACIEDVYQQQFSRDEGLGKRVLDCNRLQQELDQIAETEAIAGERRQRFLDHLVSRFCEDFTEYSLLMFSFEKDSKRARKRIIADQRTFLKNYPSASALRNSACDYRFPRQLNNESGYQRRVRLLLGIKPMPREIAGHRFRIEEVDKKWRFVLAPPATPPPVPAMGPLFESIKCESKAAIEVLLDFALGLGGAKGNYRLSDDGERYELVRRLPGTDKVQVIGAVTSKTSFIKTRAYFKKYGTSEAFHIVEHILLRRRTRRDGFMPARLERLGSRCCPEVSDPYSFRASVVLPSWPKRFRDLRFRRFVEDTLRREAPAHVFLKICWISHEQMKKFEEKYNQYADLLAGMSEQMGHCPAPGEFPNAQSMSGAMPLPAGQKNNPFSLSLSNVEEPLGLIEILHNLVTVYPLAYLHDDKKAGGDEPQVTLNNTNLGTF